MYVYRSLQVYEPETTYETAYSNTAVETPLTVYSLITRFKIRSVYRVPVITEIRRRVMYGGKLHTEIVLPTKIELPRVFGLLTTYIFKIDTVVDIGGSAQPSPSPTPAPAPSPAPAPAPAPSPQPIAPPEKIQPQPQRIPI
jgi:hypothetical protein